MSSTTINDLTKPAYKSSARRREPRDLIAGAGVHARDNRPLRRIGRLHVARLLDAICAPTTSIVANDWNERLLQRLLAAARDGDRPVRRLVRDGSRRPTVFFASRRRRPAPRRSASWTTAASARSSLPACSPAPRTRRAPGVGRLHGLARIPVGHAAQHVRVPGQPRRARCPTVFTQFQSQATDPLTMDPATIAANRDRWIQEWTDTVLH